MASCFICLGEEPDASGPLRRDCSCRGDAAGFAHIACIVEYAKAKSNAVLSEGNPYEMASDWVTAFAEKWAYCPNCEQSYCNELAVQLADHFASYVEDTFRDSDVLDRKVRTAEALCIKAIALQSLDNDDIQDTRKICSDNANEILSIVQYIRSETTLPLFDIRYQHVIFNAEVNACNRLATISLYKESEEGYDEAIQYYSTIRDRYKMIPGYNAQVERQQALIERIRKLKYRQLGDEEGEIYMTDELLKVRRSTYNGYVASSGETSHDAIQLGRELACALISKKHTIEAHRLLTKHMAISSRVYGPDHKQTERFDKLFEACNVSSKLVGRHVNGEKNLLAVRYKHGGATLVVQSETRRIAVPTNEIYFNVGCVVICNGLKNATHLNGKFGDVTSWDEEAGRYVIRFEEEGLKPALVRRENLRIAFELIDEKLEEQKSTKTKSASPTLIASTSTLWHRVRESNEITPRDRLINWCEMVQVTRLGDDDGIPEEHAAGIDTAYSYWGLPPCGGSGKVEFRCHHCRQEDFTWLVDNAGLVEEHFEDVSKMGTHMNWCQIIEYLKNEILIDSSSPIKDKTSRRNMRNFQLSYPGHTNEVPEMFQKMGMGTLW